jgi:hypothetical protein
VWPTLSVFIVSDCERCPVQASLGRGTADIATAHNPAKTLHSFLFMIVILRDLAQDLHGGEPGLSDGSVHLSSRRDACSQVTSRMFPTAFPKKRTSPCRFHSPSFD